MTTRLGIELSPTAYRVVEVEAGLAWHRHASDTRVRSLAVLPLSAPETRAKLESRRRQPAAVGVWNAPSEHRQVVVNGGSYESMRAETLGALAELGLRTRGGWADIASASHPADRSVRRPVVVALAAAAEMSAALQPIIDAGIRVLTVTTPAMALGSLARLRRPFSTPAAIEAYVALEEKLTCIALVRAGVLIAAHINLLRFRKRQASKTVLARVAVDRHGGGIGPGTAHRTEPGVAIDGDAAGGLPGDESAGAPKRRRARGEPASRGREQGGRRVYSASRRLEIVDGGIVAPGDEVTRCPHPGNHARRGVAKGWATPPQRLGLGVGVR